MARRRKQPHDPLTAIAYLRVSRDEQHVQQQRDEIERWATAQRVTILDWHVDPGVSGAAPLHKRPGLLAAIEDVRSRRAGLLVAWKRDRFARDVGSAASIQRLCGEAGATVVTADGLDASDTPEGKFIRTMFDAFAEYERELIRARTRIALASKKKRGEAIGQPPYGWKNLGRVSTGGGSSRGGQLEAVPHEQAAIDRMRALRNEGCTFETIALQLTAEGYRPRGKRWHSTTVRRVFEALRAA